MPKLENWTCLKSFIFVLGTCLNFSDSGTSCGQKGVIKLDSTQNDTLLEFKKNPAYNTESLDQCG